VSGPFSLDGRVALVTGASRGLGEAMARALAAAGADVICTSSRREGTDETAAAVRAEGRRAWQLAADVSDRAAVQRLVHEAEEAAGHVDILVNNAGTTRRHPAADFPVEDWDLVMEVNLTSVFQLCQTFGRRMIERGAGKIVNVASLLSFSGGITVPAYTASKHGVAGLTKALANEWARHNVQVNAIAPGYFVTAVTQAIQDDPVRSREILTRIPAGRWGSPDDLGGAVVFLAAPASDYVSGHLLTVDGGWMAR
jgi:2-deoxy-D-gluconate 3-dehydrogenase